MTQPDPFVRTFREVQPKFARFMARTLTERKLSLPQYALLNLLATAGKIPMTEASEKLHISKPAVTNLVDRLEKNSFLKRLADPKDRRVYLIQIQAKGESLIRETQTTILGFLLETLKLFDLKERRVISRFYELLSQTLDRSMEQKKKK